MKFIRGKATLATVLTLAMSICFLSVTSLFSLVQAAPWTEYTGEVTLDNELFVKDAWVIKEGNTYKMWYTHSRTDMGISEMAGIITSIISSNLISDFANLNLQGLLDDIANIADTPTKMDALWNFMTSTTTVIGYATSVDGIDWDVVNDEILAGNTGTLESFGKPCVINDNGTYKMWFTHSTTNLDKTGLQAILGNLDDTNPVVVRNALIDLMDITRNAVGYATSSDGIDWGTPQTNVFVGDGSEIWDSVSAPCVIEDGGIYKMWFTYAETDITSTDIDNILADISNFGVDDILNIMDNTNTIIGYTTSADGFTGWSPTSVAKAGTNGMWDSVSTPCVINNGSNYEMWFTYNETDLTGTEIQAILDELQNMGPDMVAWWESYNPADLNPFLNNFTDLIDNNLNMQAIKAYLTNTSTKIGYTTSANGTTWDTNITEALTGSGGPWGGVSAPCVVLDSGNYEMWFTQGLDELTAQNIISLLDGSDLPIGYATFGQDIELVTGWNFIGLPLSPTPPNTTDVLSDIIANVQTVWTYDAATGIWSYFTTIPGAPQGDLLQMDIGRGYWIELVNPATLTISGAEPTYPYNIDLILGWNLISIPKTPNPSATEDVLSDIIANVQTVWAYDAATGIWSYFTTIPGAPQGDLTDMTEEKAYWIEMTAADTLIIN